MTKKPKNTRQWLQSHQSDPYVQKAHTYGYRSRAAYKLLQMHQKYRLFAPGMKVVDLGACPGGWSQVVKQLTSDDDTLIALDRLEMAKIPPGVTFIQGDFAEQSIYQKLLDRLDENSGLDWVISDMAPNLTGHKTIDDARSSELVELAIDFALQMLKTNGSLLTKAFEGKSLPMIKNTLNHHFQSLKTHKPDASKSQSSEIYLLAFNKK